MTPDKRSSISAGGWGQGGCNGMYVTETVITSSYSSRAVCAASTAQE